jgi:hypothetical protein
MSIIHGTASTILTVYNLMHIQDPLNRLDAKNTPFQNALMEFSSAYFVIDLLHYAIYVPDQILFILHHIATTTYMFSCRFYTHHGAISVMALLGLAESTSLMQNIWSISSIYGYWKLHQILNVFFIPLYTIARGVLGPLLTWKLCVFYLPGGADHVIPRWLVSYWMFTVVFAITGSILWVSTKWVKLFSGSSKIQQLSHSHNGADNITKSGKSGKAN